MFRFLGRSKRAPHTEPDLPITPMLDMSFQLMAFFILTFRAAPQEGNIQLALPHQTGDALAADMPIELKMPDEAEFTIRVYAAENGSISRLIVAAAVGDRELKDSSELFTFLRSKTGGRKDNKTNVRFEFGEKLRHEIVVKLLDEAKRAGFQKISPTLLQGR